MIIQQKKHAIYFIVKHHARIAHSSIQTYMIIAFMLAYYKNHYMV